MQKLTLDVEALTVESFRPGTAPAATRQGTVHAHAPPGTQQVRCTYFCTYACTGFCP
ncbi:MAG TPA: hypothetical protein VEQ60_13610 [Longimicrobium sp.]|nr:hypothetical protein [Longimicrobium sp.]